VAFEERPAGEQRGQARTRLPQLMAGKLPPAVRENVADDGPGIGQPVGKAREQLLEYLPAPRVQGMQVTTVQNALAVQPGSREVVSVGDRYPLEMLGQDARG
jgi:hypothetical protein